MAGNLEIRKSRALGLEMWKFRALGLEIWKSRALRLEIWKLLGSLSTEVSKQSSCGSWGRGGGGVSIYIYIYIHTCTYAHISICIYSYVYIYIDASQINKASTNKQLNNTMFIHINASNVCMVTLPPCFTNVVLTVGSCCFHIRIR